MLALNFKRLASFAQTHLRALFIVFTLTVASVTGIIFLRAVILPQENSAASGPAKTQAENVNRSLRDKIFARFNQRTAGVGAALTTPVKDSF